MTATDHAVELASRRRARRLRQAGPAHHRLRRERAARDHRRLRDRLAPQRPSGQRHRRRGRGQAARFRGQAAAPRGRAGGPLGAARLRRHRRARAARGGARSSTPSSGSGATARPSRSPPTSPAARPWRRPSSCCATAGPPGTPRRRIQGQADVDLDDLGHAQAERGRAGPGRAGARRGVVLGPRPGPLRRRRTSPRESGLDATFDARLREFHLGQREGLTHDEYAGRAPAEYAAFRPRRLRRRPRWREARRGGRPDGRRARRVAAAVPEDGVALVVSHGAAIRVAVASLLGWPSEAGAACTAWTTAAGPCSPPYPPTSPWRLHAYNRTVPAPIQGPDPPVG